MRTLKLQPILYSFEGDGWNTTPVVIANAYDVDVGFRLGELNDTFEFKIPNTEDLEITNYKVMDKVTVHFLLGSDTYSSDNMLINGMVKSVTEQVTEKGKVLTISGVSFGEITTTGLVFATSVNVNVMEHLQNCLNSIALRNQNFVITWDIGNPTVKSDSSAFPKLSGGGEVRDYDKSLNKLLETYLVDKYTEDGSYYWYVSLDNKLVIRKRTNTATDILTEGTNNMLTYKFDIDASKIYNFIVVKCGDDPNGRPISTKFDDPISRAKYGFRYYMLTDTTIAGNLLEQERSQGGFTSDSNFPTAYPRILSWKTSEGDDIIVTSDNEFVEEFRIEVKRLGNAAGDSFATNNSEKLIKATIALVPTLEFSIPSVVTCTFPSYNVRNKNLRLQEIKYSDENTLLTLAEEVTT